MGGRAARRVAVVHCVPRAEHDKVVTERAISGIGLQCLLRFAPLLDGLWIAQAVFDSSLREAKDPMHSESRFSRLLAPAAVAAVATLVTGAGCARRVRVEESFVAGAPSSLAPTTVMFAQAVQVDIVRAGVSRALVERHFQPETEEGQRVYARFSHRRGSIRVAIDYTATQAVITPVESSDVDDREWQSWARALSQRIEEEVNRPGQQAAELARQQQEQAQAAAAAEAQRQTNERLERERLATQREQARAQAASAEANAREQARLERQQRAEQARLERAQRAEAVRLERERVREEARLRRLGLTAQVQVQQPQQPQIVVVAPQLQIGTQPQQQQVAPPPSQSGLFLNRGQANFGVHNVYGTNLASPYVVNVISGGNLEARQQGIPSNCMGFVTQQADVIVNYTSPSRRLAFFVDGQGDTTLIVRAPNGQWWCSDDEGGGQNPLIDMTNPQQGQYEVWVGSYRSTEQLRGAFQVYDPNMLAQQQQQAQVVQVQPVPNCRALAMSTGNPAYASSCTADIDPYCAEAVFQSGAPAYVTSCRNVDRACAVAAARAGQHAYITSCTAGIDSQCAVAAIEAGTPAYITSCRH